MTWNPFPTPEYEKLRERITEVSYDLRIWMAGPRGRREWAREHLAYSRSGLVGPIHRVEEPLAPGTEYVWSVRARFKLDGEWRMSPWSAESAWERTADLPESGYARLSTDVR